MTNENLIAFDSKIISKFMSDTSRHFPPMVALKFVSLFSQFPEKLKLYHKKVNKKIEELGGTIINGGEIEADEETREKIKEEIAKINKQQVEFQGEKIKIGDDWPGIAIAEMYILQLILIQR